MDLLSELSDSFPQEDHQRIERTKDRYRPRASHYIGQEMGLVLSQDKERLRQRMSFDVNVVDWYGSPLYHVLEQSDASFVELLLDVNRGAIISLAQSSSKIEQLLARIQRLDYDFPTASIANQQVLNRANEIAEELLRHAASAGTLEILRKINEDVLGAYFPDDNPTKGHVVLYWQAISLFARQLGVSVENLTVVVLLHEITHAYTHLGYDITNRRFDRDRFFHSANLAAAEGLAQFFTEHVSLKWQEDGEPDIYPAYRALLEGQNELYHVHEAWRDTYDLEVIRAALLKLRETPVESGDTDFDSILMITKKHLNREAPRSSMRRL